MTLRRHGLRGSRIFGHPRRWLGGFILPVPDHARRDAARRPP